MKLKIVKNYVLVVSFLLISRTIIAQNSHGRSSELYPSCVDCGGKMGTDFRKDTINHVGELQVWDYLQCTQCGRKCYADCHNHQRWRCIRYYTVKVSDYFDSLVVENKCAGQKPFQITVTTKNGTLVRGREFRNPYILGYMFTYRKVIPRNSVVKGKFVKYVDKIRDWIPDEPTLEQEKKCQELGKQMERR